MMTDRRSVLAGLAAVAAAPSSPWAQGAWPNAAVKVAVPFSAGSTTDILARAIGQRLSAKWGQAVIVENRPGIAGAQSVAKGAADGTLMLTSNGHVAINAVNKNAAFDAVKDFAPVAKVASAPSILIVPANSPARTLQDLIAMAKAASPGLQYASAGVASSTGIAAELFRSLVGANLQMVPHRGLPEANTSVLRGDTQLGFTFFAVGGDLVRTGQLRALAVTGGKRLAPLPDVPTFAEAGLPAFDYDSWFGVLAAAGTPKPILDKASADILEVVRAPDLATQFAPQGVVIEAMGPVEFGAAMAKDADRFGKLLEGRAG
ncbi:MAG: tripartite tricarboxylate transporter substrate-binding protein [Beijerinckiaceae bacterium]